MPDGILHWCEETYHTFHGAKKMKCHLMQRLVTLKALQKMCNTLTCCTTASALITHILCQLGAFFDSHYTMKEALGMKQVILKGFEKYQHTGKCGMSYTSLSEIYNITWFASPWGQFPHFGFIAAVNEKAFAMQRNPQWQSSLLTRQFLIWLQM